MALWSRSYVFATPVLGGQASVSLMAAYGVVGTSLAGTLSGVLTGPFGNTVPFARSDTINDTTWGFGDLAPMFQLRWNAGVHNYMTYVTGDIPVGAYQSDRLSNIGIGHGAIDAGGGYTYFNPQTGHEFSGVLGFTYNTKNTATQYQSGVDMHFDWGASQFLSKQVMVGLVGYVYKELGCDSGSGDRVGCFQSQVVGIGPQIGFLFPVGDMQGYLNLKAYGEFAAEIVPVAGIPGSPSLSRRPRPERLRRQSRSSGNIRINQAAACQCDKADVICTLLASRWGTKRCSETPKWSRDDIDSLFKTLLRQWSGLMSVIGYARVSTTDQNLDVQESAFARGRLHPDPFGEAHRHHHRRTRGASHRPRLPPQRPRPHYSAFIDELTEHAAHSATARDYRRNRRGPFDHHDGRHQPHRPRR